MQTELIMKKITSFIISICAVFSLFPCGAGCGSDGHSREFENIILVIGDGMGENHILNAIDYYNLATPSFMADQQGYIITDSLSGTTDSAAGGTALATGTKVFNGSVAQHDGVDLQRITDIAKAAKMKTGVVTTDTLLGATPSAFSAHALNRSDEDDILTTQATSKIDLLLGQYSGKYQYYEDYFLDEKYTIVSTEDDLQANKNKKKLIGHFKEIASEYIPGNADDFQLKEMTQFAVEYLENKNGFFLMVEGAYIDKHSHSNAFEQAMAEMRSLIDTLEYLYNYAADGKTAIFFTADHETGGLKRLESDTENYYSLYTSTDHTSTNVPLFVKNYAFDVQNFGYAAGQIPQNTVVFEACKSIIQGNK